ncbi:MAG: hypothetical protein Q8N44_04390, partial [Rubrivivax sp.]|nr:hypothetical protein [Rubrivivax sp.]
PQPAPAPTPTLAAPPADRLPRPTVATQNPAAPAQSLPSTPAPAVRAEVASGAAALPQPAAALPPPPKAAMAPATTPAPATAGPTERCGSRVLLAQWLCIQRECGTAELRNHAECVKWRNDQEKNANSVR